MGFDEKSVHATSFEPDERRARISTAIKGIRNAPARRHRIRAGTAADSNPTAFRSRPLTRWSESKSAARKTRSGITVSAGRDRGPVAAIT